MFYLSIEEANEWRELSRAVIESERFDPSMLAGRPLRSRPALCYYLGTELLAEGRAAEAERWLVLGARTEPIRANAYLLDYLERHNGELVPVQPSFSDVRPWAHFSSLPHLRSAREVLAGFCDHSLPDFERPFKVMDIGCGNAALTVSVLRRMVESGKAPAIGEVLLMDPSPEMLAAARANVEEAFPDVKVLAVEGKLEEASSGLPNGFDFALCSLSVHHMPYEEKAVHIGALSGAVENIVVFELGANHDTPEMRSPELVYSVYQTFGQSLEYIFGQDAPLEVQEACADIFVMSETISLLTEPRGRRTEYHMPGKQWHEVLETACSPKMTCLGETTCFHDEYCELLALHYGS